MIPNAALRRALERNAERYAIPPRPTPTFRAPIWHRGWRIWREVNPVWPALDWAYEHEDRDDEDESDDRHGLAGSIEAARAGIDQWIAETPPAWCESCDRDGLRTGDLSHGLCAHCAAIEAAEDDGWRDR